MKTWQKVALVTVASAALGFIAGQILWPPAPDMPAPTAGQRPFAILFALLESASLGLGVAFLCFGWPRARRLADGSPALARAAFASIAWGLISWWAHGHLHRHAGVPDSSADLTGLLVLEYAFHGTLILGGLIVAAAFLRLPLPESRAAAALPAPRANV